MNSGYAIAFKFSLRLRRIPMTFFYLNITVLTNGTIGKPSIFIQLRPQVTLTERASLWYNPIVRKKGPAGPGFYNNGLRYYSS